MAKSVLSAEHFHDKAAALAFIDARTWPNGPACPRRGERNRIGRLNGKTTKKWTRTSSFNSVGRAGVLVTTIT